ncbi:MAG: hydantoinase/oxoprolinase family protein, partial [Gammaproteobacteria bacterium]|nr:hydantoinase/oxoprolinase family protein [Gammaproteobacteria bacterium]
GGDQPTVTDAALLLGYLDPGYFLGGRMSLDVDASRQVISQLAQNLGLKIEDAAWSIMRIANELMIKAIQEICMTEGVNPRESTIVAGGGAAGLNILPIAGELGVRSVILPKTAGALSACGMQYSDIMREASASHVTHSNEFDHSGVSSCLARIRAESSSFIESMKNQGFFDADITLSVEARYLGQVWELETPLPPSGLATHQDLKELVENFHQVHERVLGVRDPDSALECLNWKAKARVKLGRQSKQALAKARPHNPTPHSIRKGFFGSGWNAVPVFHGVDLTPGAVVCGPAIIEEPTTTIVVYPGFDVALSEHGNYVTRLQPE